ncbi:MAG: type II toxin-antitoxin system RelB/DinJ family antitoxin [Synergistaceae bacterium]|nr:type II toxin-antitoxin system RelB/DinJ family antitoxin [Synergistota bacterium]NLM70422.1 type II toxin-antitoxin system RelB/DinJ family antitoxin [Synergistaceae bacterium]
MGERVTKTKRHGYRSVNVRLSARDKELAESIFRKVGLTPTEAIRLFYRQTINTGGIPFGLVLPKETLAAMREAESGTAEELSLDDLKAELDAIR